MQRETVPGSGRPSSHGRLIAAAATAAATLLLAACGSSEGGAANGGATSTATDQAVSTATAGTATGTPAPTPTTTAAPTPASPTPLPAIVIDQPQAGATVHSPFHVTGTANTFEATFRLQLKDASGTVLLDEQVMATSGTGTRGTYDATVTTGYHGQATLTAYERSAKDGSPTNLTSVAVVVG